MQRFNGQQGPLLHRRSPCLYTPPAKARHRPLFNILQSIATIRKAHLFALLSCSLLKAIVRGQPFFAYTVIGQHRGLCRPAFAQQHAADRCFLCRVPRTTTRFVHKSFRFSLEISPLPVRYKG